MATITNASEVINRIKDLKYFRVTRNVDSFPLFGVVPFDLTHTAGGPLEVKLLALSQEEAERLVDEWLESSPSE